LTNVLPLTEKGRAPVLWTTAGGKPPRFPVKVWTFEEVVAVELALEAAAAA
jgi:hypothetical protein